MSPWRFGGLVHACVTFPFRGRGRRRGGAACGGGRAGRPRRRRVGGSPRRQDARPRPRRIGGDLGRAGPVPSYGAATWPDEPDRPSASAMLAVLEHQRPEVPRVEQLDVEVRVQLAQPAELAVLLADELLAEGRHLEVEVEVGQVEVRREALDDVAIEVPQDREGVRLVLPAHGVEVEDPRHLGLAGVREGRSVPSPVQPADEVAVPGGEVQPDGFDVGRVDRPAATGDGDRARCGTVGGDIEDVAVAVPPSPGAAERGAAAVVADELGRRRGRRGVARSRIRPVGTGAPQAVHVRRRGADSGRSRGPIGGKSSRSGAGRDGAWPSIPPGGIMRAAPAPPGADDRLRIPTTDESDRGAPRRRAPPDPSHFRHSYSKDKAQLVRRLSRMEGQVRGIARMIEREEYCVDILQQTAALRAAVDCAVDPRPRGPRRGLRPDRRRAGRGRRVRGRGHRRRPPHARPARPQLRPIRLSSGIRPVIHEFAAPPARFVDNPVDAGTARTSTVRHPHWGRCEGNAVREGPGETRP